jgi:hypothetical protein
VNSTVMGMEGGVEIFEGGSDIFGLGNGLGF